MLSPWDAYRWFETPVETAYSGLATGDKIAAHNVRRVVLIMAVQQSGDSARVTTVPGTQSAQGIQLTGQQTPLILTQQQHGPLTQVDWFVASAPLSGICVIEVMLRDWPHSEEGPPDGA